MPARKTRKTTGDFLARHRAHDYPFLVRRWRAVARRAGLVMRRLAPGPDYSLYSLHTPRLPRDGAIYISAGIHGDEPAGTEALVTWAEQNTRLLRRHPFLLIPCVNPWGLVNNVRTDSQRRDLNRSFQDDAIPQIAALRRLIARRKFSLSLTLHEDYDAQGIYIYEIPDLCPFWGEALLAAAHPHIPIDSRPVIETREAVNGLVRRPLDMEIFKEIGLPEAVYLHLQGCQRVFTIETPSEYSLDRRIHAQIAVINESLRLLSKVRM